MYWFCVRWSYWFPKFSREELVRGGSRERSEREILTELFEDFTHSSPLGESISADLEDRAWGSWDRRESETLWNYSVISSIKTWGVSDWLPYTVENISVGKYSNINIRHQYIVKSSLLFISKKRVWHPNFASISHCQIFYSTWNVKNFITTFFRTLQKSEDDGEKFYYPPTCFWFDLGIF